jgi:hypothetical protein
VGCGITVVAGNNVGVQMGHRVPEEVEVHLQGAEHAVKRATNPHHVIEEEGAVRFAEIVGLAHMAVTEQHAVTQHKLIPLHPETTEPQIGDIEPLVID